MEKAHTMTWKEQAKSMTSPYVIEPGNPVIELYGASGLGLIVLYSSGVSYTNQTGGYACLHPVIEGVYAPLSDTQQTQQQQLLAYCTGSKYQGWCTEGIDEEDASAIDAILAQEGDSACLRVNRETFKESHEAWGDVTIHEPVDPSPNWKTQPGYTLYGFVGQEGVLTWENRD
jgi:hypothetical protein